MENDKHKNNRIKKFSIVIGIIVILIFCLSRCSFGSSNRTPNNEKETDITDNVDDNDTEESDGEKNQEVEVPTDDEEQVDTPSNDNSSTKPADSNNNSNDASTPSAPDTPSKPEKPSHTHRYDIPVYKTVHHDAVYEEKWVVDTPAWDEKIYEERPYIYCNQCGFKAYSADEIYSHLENNDDCSGYTSDYEDVLIETIHHKEEGHYENKKVQDAYDEEIITGYKCSCGATK